MTPDRWRCPTCRIIHWSPLAWCGGGWPYYDPQRPAGERRPTHDPVQVVPDHTDRLHVETVPVGDATVWRIEAVLYRHDNDHPVMRLPIDPRCALIEQTVRANPTITVRHRPDCSCGT